MPEELQNASSQKNRSNARLTVVGVVILLLALLTGLAFIFNSSSDDKNVESSAVKVRTKVKVKRPGTTGGVIDPGIILSPTNPGPRDQNGENNGVHTGSTTDSLGTNNGASINNGGTNNGTSINNGGTNNGTNNGGTNNGTNTTSGATTDLGSDDESESEPETNEVDKIPDYGIFKPESYTNESTFAMIRTKFDENHGLYDDLYRFDANNEYLVISSFSHSYDFVTIPAYSALTKKIAYSFSDKDPTMGSVSTLDFTCSKLEENSFFHVDDPEKSAPLKDLMNPNFSPNGEYVVYCRSIYEKKRVYISKLNGVYVEGDSVEIYDSFDLVAPYFSNDGKSLFLVELGEPCSITVFDLVKKSAKTIVEFIPMDKQFNHMFSLDQSKIATTVVDENGKLNFYITPLKLKKKSKGKNAEVNTNNAEATPVHSIDVNTGDVYRLVSFRDSILRYSVSKNSGDVKFEIYEFNYSDSSPESVKIEFTQKPKTESGTGSGGNEGGDEEESIYGHLTPEQLNYAAKYDPLFIGINDTNNSVIYVPKPVDKNVFQLLYSSPGSYSIPYKLLVSNRASGKLVLTKEIGSPSIVYDYDEDDGSISSATGQYDSCTQHDFSPNGKYGLYVKNEGDSRNLIIAPIRTSTDDLDIMNQSEIVEIPNTEEVDFARFSNDGKKIIYIVKLSVEHHYKIMQYDFKEKESKVLQEDVFMKNGNYALSLDQSKIATINEDGGNFELLIANLNENRLENFELVIDWGNEESSYSLLSFQNNYIFAAAKFGRDELVEVYSFDLELVEKSKNMEAGAGEKKDGEEVHNGEDDLKEEGIVTAKFDELSFFVFQLDNSQYKTRAKFLVRGNEGDVEKFVIPEEEEFSGNPSTHISYSRTGRAYASLNFAESSIFWRRSASTGNWNLVDSSSILFPSFHPDGDKFIYSEKDEEERKWYLFIFDSTKDTGIRKIEYKADFPIKAEFSNDGKSLICISLLGNERYGKLSKIDFESIYSGSEELKIDLDIKLPMDNYGTMLSSDQTKIVSARYSLNFMVFYVTDLKVGAESAKVKPPLNRIGKKLN